MDHFLMSRYTIIAPHVRNDGSMSGYPAALRDALLTAGIDGWTEHETHGSWRGKREAGTTFEIMRPSDAYGERSAHGMATLLCAAGRAAMPDQDAIQVTVEPGAVNVFEG